ncbi:MAG TPA: TfoX/Sxy family protein [Actinomycetota bacterium]|nr:TfoX/Sxy family protein [Actinomycetota bacterium]
MTAQDRFVEFVLDQLSGLAGVRTRRMFGGLGLYLRESFFGLVYDGRLYLKTDDETRGWFEERGMSSFQPNERQRFPTYMEVPAESLEEPEELSRLAAEAASRPARR